MGELSVTAEAVLPDFIHKKFKVDTEMNICIHKICPREEKSLFKSFNKMFSSFFTKDQEKDREFNIPITYMTICVTL